MEISNIIIRIYKNTNVTEQLEKYFSGNKVHIGPRCTTLFLTDRISRTLFNPSFKKNFFKWLGRQTNCDYSDADFQLDQLFAKHTLPITRHPSCLFHFVKNLDRIHGVTGFKTLTDDGPFAPTSKEKSFKDYEQWLSFRAISFFAVNNGIFVNIQTSKDKDFFKAVYILSNFSTEVFNFLSDCATSMETIIHNIKPVVQKLFELVHDDIFKNQKTGITRDNIKFFSTLPTWLQHPSHHEFCLKYDCQKKLMLIFSRSEYFQKFVDLISTNTLCDVQWTVSENVVVNSSNPHQPSDYTISINNVKQTVELTLSRPPISWGNFDFEMETLQSFAENIPDTDWTNFMSGLTTATATATTTTTTTSVTGKPRCSVTSQPLNASADQQLLFSSPSLQPPPNGSFTPIITNRELQTPLLLSPLPATPAQQVITSPQHPQSTFSPLPATPPQQVITSPQHPQNTFTPCQTPVQTTSSHQQFFPTDRSVFSTPSSDSLPPDELELPEKPSLPSPVLSKFPSCESKEKVEEKKKRGRKRTHTEKDSSEPPNESADMKEMEAKLVGKCVDWLFSTDLNDYFTEIFDTMKLHFTTLKNVFAAACTSFDKALPVLEQSLEMYKNMLQPEYWKGYFAFAENIGDNFVNRRGQAAKGGARLKIQEAERKHKGFMKDYYMGAWFKYCEKKAADSQTPVSQQQHDSSDPVTLPASQPASQGSNQT